MNLKSNNTVNFSDFQNNFITVLHKHALRKKKVLRFNNSSFMPKVLRKANMHRSKLKKTLIAKKRQMQTGQIIKNTRIFASLYFGELTKTIFRI